MHRCLHFPVLAASLVLMLQSLAYSASICLARNGAARATIGVDHTATETERFAAQELRDYLNQITGGSFSIGTTPGRQDEVRLLVGPSETVRSLLPEVKWEELGDDAIVIRTLANTLILAGGRPRGTLYAVYTFLEDYLGCRWWTKDAGLVPERKTIRLGNINRLYTPPFFYRCVHSASMYSETGPLGARLKLNGEVPALPDSLGGHIRIKPFVHTFYELLPPARYFGPHPEWYGEAAGVRASEGRQLCLSNSAMRAELTRNALALIAADPQAGIISISQNDGAPPCGCVACLAQDATYGGPSGTLINLVNACAEEIEHTYPNYRIETLAYTYSRTAPTSDIRARRNVIVRLCSIECDFATPLDSPRNRNYFNDLQAWQQVTGNLFIWDYVWNYHKQLIPHPNWQVLGANLRLFAAHGVAGVFEQDDRANPTIHFTQMRTWVLAHLLWDPTRDQKELMQEFLAGYYGPAGKYIDEYLTLIGHAAIANTSYLPCWNDDPGFLTLPQMKRCGALLDRAARAVRENPMLSQRLQIERLAFDHLVLLNRRACPALEAWIPKAQAETMAKAFMAQCSASGNTWLAEGTRLPENYEDILAGRLYVTYNGLPIPPMTRPATVPEVVSRTKIPARQWVDLQEPRFNLLAPDTLVSDPDASNGVAVRMHGTPTGVWSPQAQLLSSDCRWGPVKMHVSLKLESGQAAGGTYEIGVYDGVSKAYLLRRHVALDDLTSGGYHEYEVGVFVPAASAQIYLVPPRNEAEQRVLYLDRLILVPTAQ